MLRLKHTLPYRESRFGVIKRQSSYFRRVKKKIDTCVCVCVL